MTSPGFRPAPGARKTGLRFDKTFLAPLLLIFLPFSLAAAVLIGHAPGVSSRDPGVQGVASSPIRVVTTLFPYADVVKVIAGSRAQVTYLLPPGASPHTFEPRPSQVRAAAQAHLLIWNGAQLDDWAQPLARASGSETATLVMTEGLDLLPVGEGQPHEQEGQDQESRRDTPRALDAHGHEHGSGDPHVWLDPVLMRDVLAPRIAAALSALAPEFRAEFQANLARFQEELTALHEEILQATEGLRRRQFVVHHSAWRYFAARYGLEEVSALYTSPGREPSPQQLVQLVQLARELGINTVFSEPQLNPQGIHVIAEELGAQVAFLDPLGDESLPERGSYLDLMRFNVRSLVTALGE